MASEFDELLNPKVYLLLVAPVRSRKHGKVRRLVGGWVGRCAWLYLSGAADGVWSAVSEYGRVGAGSVLLTVEEHLLDAPTRQQVDMQLSVLWEASGDVTGRPTPASVVTSSASHASRPEGTRSGPWKQKWSKLRGSPIESVPLTFTPLRCFADSLVFQLPDPASPFFRILRSAHLAAVNGAYHAAYDLSAHGVTPEAGEILDAHGGTLRWDQARRGGTCAERLKRYLLPILPRPLRDGASDSGDADTPNADVAASSLEAELERRPSNTDLDVLRALMELHALNERSACSGDDLAKKLDERYEAVTQRVHAIWKKISGVIASGTKGKGYWVTPKGQAWLSQWGRGPDQISSSGNHQA